MRNSGERDGSQAPGGTGRGSFLRSVSWHYLGYAVEFGVGVGLLAYVVRRIPIEDYGIYLLAQSLAAFLYILDLGLSNVLVQLYVSKLAAKRLSEAASLAGTIFTWLLGMGLAGAAVLCGAALLLPELVRLPSAHTVLALEVLMVAALAVPLTLPAMAFDHLCQALERFDRINHVQIGAAALRVALTVAVLAAGKGVVALAAVQVAVALARLLGLWVTAQASLGVHLRPWSIDRARLREALRATGWAFGDDLARRIGMNAETVILAALSPLREVALFGVGSRLPAHLFQFASRGLSVMLPSLSRHHAEGDTARLRASYCNAYRACLTGLAPLALFAAICARPLMEVWAGKAYADAAPVLAWLLIASISLTTEFPSDLVLYSHDRIAQAARFSIWETVGKIVVALALAEPFGAAGVAAGVALWHWCVNLFAYLPAACRVAGIAPWEPWAQSLAAGWRRAAAGQAAAFALGAGALLAAVRLLPQAWSFVACGVVSLLYAAVWGVFTALPMWRASRRAAAAQTVGASA
jgi:O-antigen/teichoic acid export membrane protein